MTKVILEQESFKLDKLTGRVEVCDRSGRRLGYFIPASAGSPDEGLEAPFTEEELQKAEHEPGGYTTAEVLAHLKGLGTR